ncbi:hypothetical protein GCM10020000_58320 [Streptomyces olivoverticillatus]
MELPYALLLLAVLGYAEYAYGAWWAAGAFLYGHVGASLLVYGGLRALRTNAATRSAVDVGISYGRNALAGALAATLRGARVRTSSCTVLIALSARPFLRGRTDFTDAGHLVSLGLGLSLGAWGAASRTRLPFPTIKTQSGIAHKQHIRHIRETAHAAAARCHDHHQPP